MTLQVLPPGYLSDDIHKLDGFRLRPSTAAAAAATPPASPAPESPSEATSRPKGKKRAKCSTIQGIHRAFEANLQFRDLAVRDRVEKHAAKAKTETLFQLGTKTIRRTRVQTTIKQTVSNDNARQ